MRTDQHPDRNLRPRPFGRAKPFSAAAIATPSTIADDLRLFLLTFAGGFLFMTIFLA